MIIEQGDEHCQIHVAAGVESVLIVIHVGENGQSLVLFISVCITGWAHVISDRPNKISCTPTELGDYQWLFYDRQ